MTGTPALPPLRAQFVDAREWGPVSKAPRHLDVLGDSPAEYIANVIEWLEGTQRSGFLERTYITATLLVAVSESEAWTWLVSPHGLVHGRTNGVMFGSTDLRHPVLRQLAAMKDSGFRSPGSEAADHASSICCVGTPAGYERICTSIAPGDVVIALERGTLPFGPWPVQPVALEALWAMDAAWKHGLPGQGVILGHVDVADLALPHDWRVRELPIA